MLKLGVWVILLSLVHTTLWGQNEWSKNKKNKLYQDCLKTLVDEQPQLSEEQQTDFCYCYLTKVTSDYTESNIDNMIDPEIDRLMENYEPSCAKEVGIDNKLVNKSAEESGWTKSLRKQYFDECKQKTKNKKPELSDNELDEYCVCFLTKLTDQYTYNQVQNMLGIEYEKASEKLYENCRSTTGKSEEKQKGFNKKPNEKDLVGTWRSDLGGIITFHKDGTYYQEDSGVSISGKWEVMNGKLITRNMGLVARYEFIHFSETYIRYKWLFNGKVSEFYKQ